MSPKRDAPSAGPESSHSDRRAQHAKQPQNADEAHQPQAAQNADCRGALDHVAGHRKKRRHLIPVAADIEPPVAARARAPDKFHDEDENDAEVDRIIADATRQLRYVVRDRTEATLLAKHNEDYGFARNADGTERKVKHYYVQESVGIACGFLIAALHWMGLATLTHTPSPMGFLSKILNRPPNEKPYLLLPVGYPADDAQVPRS